MYYDGCYLKTNKTWGSQANKLLVDRKNTIYRVIHNSFRHFRPLWYSSQDGHAEGEHVNRGRDIPSFCPTLQVLDMSTLGDAADVNPVIKILPHGKSRGIGGTFVRAPYAT
jgi:hypothetical protein